MLPVNDKVGGNADGEGHGPNDVLDHSVCSGFIQFSMGGKSVNMLIAELGCFGNQFTSFLDAEFVQSFDSTVVNRHGAPMLRLGDSFLESIAAWACFLIRINGFNALINALIIR